VAPSGEHTAVHGQDNAVDKAGVIAAQEVGGAGQLVHGAEAAGRNGVDVDLQHVLGDAAHHIRTDMMLAVGEEKLQDAINNRIPMRRLGEPEEIASVAAFLAGEDASWVTGQTLMVSGGGTVN